MFVLASFADKSGCGILDLCVCVCVCVCVCGVCVCVCARGACDVCVWGGV